jgi:excisionase family DNA binding protein
VNGGVTVRDADPPLELFRTPPSPFVRLLKPNEVAEELGVSRSWVYAAADDGRLPSVRLGGPDGPLRFVPEDLHRWLQEARANWRPGRQRRATPWSSCLARTDGHVVLQQPRNDMTR